MPGGWRTLSSGPPVAVRRVGSRRGYRHETWCARRCGAVRPCRKHRLHPGDASAARIPQARRRLHRHRSPTLPGQDATIVVQAHDDKIINGVFFRTLRVGDGRTFPDVAPCTSTMDRSADQTSATFTITCHVPTFANNGVWDLTVTVDDDFTGLNVHLPFQVVGGTDDTKPPHLESIATDPPVITTTTGNFTLTTVTPTRPACGPSTAARCGCSRWARPPPATRPSSASPRKARSCRGRRPTSCGRATSTPPASRRAPTRGSFEVIDGLGHKVSSNVTGIVVVTATRS